MIIQPEPNYLEPWWVVTMVTSAWLWSNNSSFQFNLVWLRNLLLKCLYQTKKVRDNVYMVYL